MKEEAKEIVQAVSETIKERASNPIIVTFIISWCVYNWNAFFLLTFSKEAIAKRIDEVSLQFQNTDSWLTPIIFTVAYSLFSKPLNLGLRKLMEKVDHLFIVIEHSKKKKGLVLGKEREVLRAENEMAYEGTKTQHEKYIQDMKEEITESKDREGILTQELTRLTDDNNILLEKTSSYEIERSNHITVTEELNKKITELNRIIRNLNEQEKIKESYITDLNEKLHSLESTNIEYKSIKVAYESELLSSSTKINELNTLLTKKEKEISILSHDLTESNKENLRLIAKNNDLLNRRHNGNVSLS